MIQEQPVLFTEETLELLSILPDDNQKHLTNSDYVIGTIRSADNKVYKFVHGFPGDTPVGFVFTYAKPLIVATIGEHLPELEQWYEQATQTTIYL